MVAYPDTSLRMWGSIPWYRYTSVRCYSLTPVAARATHKTHFAGGFCQLDMYNDLYGDNCLHIRKQTFIPEVLKANKALLSMLSMDYILEQP